MVEFLKRYQDIQLWMSNCRTQRNNKERKDNHTWKEQFKWKINRRLY